MLLLQYYIGQRDPIGIRAAEAEAYIQSREAQAWHWLEQDSLWLARSEAGGWEMRQRLWSRTDWPEGVAFLLHRGQQLHFWTDYQLRWPAPGGHSEPVFSPGKRGKPQYWLHQNLPDDWTVSAAVAFPRQGLYRADGPGLPIRNLSEEPIAYLPKKLEKDSGVRLPYYWQALHFGSRMVLLFCLLLLAGRSCRWLGRRFGAVAGLGLGALVALLLFVNVPDGHYAGLPYVQGLHETPLLGYSLLHLLLASVLAIWLLSLAQGLFHQSNPAGLRVFPPAMLSLGAYFSIILGLLLGGALFRALLLRSGLPFDFNNVLNLSALELSAMGAIVLLLLTLLLYSLWVVRGVHQLGMERNRRLLTLGLAVVLSLPLAWLLQLGLGLLPLLLLSLLYIALLDLFVDIEAASPAWLLLWLALLSAFSAGLLFKYNLDQGRAQRLAYAQEVTHPVDAEAEQELQRLANGLPEEADPEKLDSLLAYFPYLEKNFRAKILDRTAATALGLPKLKARYSILPPNERYFTYGLQWGNQCLVLQPKLQNSRRVMRRLTPTAPQQSSRYQLSLFKDSVLIAQRGYFRRAWLSAEQWPAAGGSAEALNSQRANLYYRPGNGYKVIVGEALGGYIKPISLFSYLFALLTVAALLLFGLNRLRPFLPATPGSLLFGPPSLRHRIQLSVLALTLFAFLFISAVTVASLQQSSREDQTEQLLSKVEVLLRDLEAEGIAPEERGALRALSEVHQVDISTFGPDGMLLSSSVPFLYEEGWQAPRINPAALRAHREQGYKPAILQEKAGTLEYLAAYAPVRRPETGQDVFFRIPFAADNRKLEQNVLHFIGNLLNLYVFLLLIAGGIAITVANSITRPLMKIGEKLRSFRLGQNEPLEWDSEDEIGKLVSEYNAMIVKLEESAEKLRQSEREGAWREMAKQVAHEIKNPLTPMKLSIQYLQHARRSDPERAAAMIGSVSETLIEQINGLARIATEFSNFAKMPKAELEALPLNEQVRAVYRLFTEHQEPEERFTLELPEEELQVFADKGHLNRVLTNLLKNAQQAIPEKRQGAIKLSLERAGQTAVIAVEDNGSGIPQEVQASVFQPNFTTKSSGMGLGLAMCKSMIESAGGTIFFETEEGKGTRFVVELPLYEGKGHEKQPA